MVYDFDAVTNRSGTNAYKWEIGAGELPMWVADMDFPTAPAVREAIERRAAHGVFGYSVIPPAWNSAIVAWWQQRHAVIFSPESVIFCAGVVPAISSMIRKLTTPAEKVLVQTPVYNIFFNSICNNGRFPVENPLQRTADGYEIDWTDLEQKLSNPQVTLMLLCNPQNPGGIIWGREDLSRIGALCARYHVTVISDEIHCDLTDPGYDYVPFASASDTCRAISITCVAPSKAFNIAGLQGAAVIAADEALRHKVWRGLNTDECAEPNAFAIQAAIAAFTVGGEWLDALRMYIAANKAMVRGYLQQELPEITMVDGHATYLCWLDCRQISRDDLQLAADIRQKTGLFLSNGSQYGAAGAGYLRMNVACPRHMVEDGLDRLRRAVRL
ncbi:MAG: pyridoxal phosphate-dependent aminotransferase [Selenomonas sp.]|jgi:cystathionine beta-lyase|nr:pyridoxal phosphate-dependent aminotransferase [Selenomonas sp.]